VPTSEPTPLWHRMPGFFQYPLQTRALAVVLPAAALYLLLPPTFFGLLAFLVLSALLVKYLYEVLDHSSEGHLEPPPLSSEVLLEGYALPFKQLLVLYLAGSLIGVAFVYGGVFLGVVALIGIQLALPASVMLLATTRSFRSAIHPGLLLELIRTMGRTYWILYGCLVLLNLSSGSLAWALSGRVPGFVLDALVGFASLYFAVIMFHMMGYALFQHHAALGYEPAGQAVEEEPELALYRQLLEEENYPAAREELQALLAQRPDDLELHRQLQRLCRLTGADAAGARHAVEFIARLLEGKRIREASEVYLEAVTVTPQLRPARPEHYLPLCRMLRDRGAHREAIALANGFHRRHPAHPDIPELYLLAAQIFHLELEQPARAAQVLGFLQTHFPDHPLQSQVTRQLNALQSSAPA
jgi:tetratricopeptide (TPR) repeat protein